MISDRTKSLMKGLDKEMSMTEASQFFTSWLQDSGMKPSSAAAVGIEMAQDIIFELSTST